MLKKLHTLLFLLIFSQAALCQKIAPLEQYHNLLGGSIYNLSAAPFNDNAIQAQDIENFRNALIFWENHPDIQLDNNNPWHLLFSQEYYFYRNYYQLGGIQLDGDYVSPFVGANAVYGNGGIQPLNGDYNFSYSPGSASVGIGRDGTLEYYIGKGLIASEPFITRADNWKDLPQSDRKKGMIAILATAAHEFTHGLVAPVTNQADNRQLALTEHFAVMVEQVSFYNMQTAYKVTSDALQPRPGYSMGDQLNDIRNGYFVLARSPGLFKKLMGLTGNNRNLTFVTRSQFENSGLESQYSGMAWGNISTYLFIQN
ncbi:MAG: hypothetical protein ACR2PT_12440 [Endozoicomonas sp.]